MSLLFNTLFGFIIAFFKRSKHLLISWLQSLSTVILEAKKIKSVTVSTVSPSICHELMGPDAMILVFWKLSFSQPLHYLLSPSSRYFLVLLHFLYSALNKPGDNIQPSHTLFPIWNQSVVPCLVLTVGPWPAHRFFRRQVRWSGIPISWRISHRFFCDPHTQRL